MGDSFNYAISLYVVGHTLKKRAAVSIIKGLTMLGLGVFILVETWMKIRNGIVPEPPTMGLIGSIALCVNVSVALLLYRYREGDSNMKSVWLCSRNDAIGNILVILAAVLVGYTQAGWPDWCAGVILAFLGVQSGMKVIKLARVELKQ